MKAQFELDQLTVLSSAWLSSESSFELTVLPYAYIIVQPNNKHIVEPTCTGNIQL